MINQHLCRFFAIHHDDRQPAQQDFAPSMKLATSAIARYPAVFNLLKLQRKFCRLIRRKPTVGITDYRTPTLSGIGLRSHNPPLLRTTPSDIHRQFMDNITARPALLPEGEKVVNGASRPVSRDDEK
jgi:hypothetical protein